MNTARKRLKENRGFCRPPRPQSIPDNLDRLIGLLHSLLDLLFININIRCLIHVKIIQMPNDEATHAWLGIITHPTLASHYRKHGRARAVITTTYIVFCTRRGGGGYVGGGCGHQVPPPGASTKCGPEVPADFYVPLVSSLKTAT